MKRSPTQTNTFRRLVQIRLRSLTRAGLRMDWLERFSISLLVLGILYSLVAWRMKALNPLFAATKTEALPEALRNAAFQTEAVLAALCAFISYSTLWYADDLDILDPLPLHPKDILNFRIVTALIYSFPFVILAFLAYLPLFYPPWTSLGIEIFAAFLYLWLISALGGMGWHVLAAASAGTHHLAFLKELLAGAMVRPERTFLLYAPMVAGAMTIGCVSLFQRGTASLLTARPSFGVLSVSASIALLGLIFLVVRRLFERFYYEALASYLEGEEAGALPESEVNEDYLGQRWVERMPERFRPLVRRDLQQSWRRGRLDGVFLIGASWLAFIAALVHRLDDVSSLSIWSYVCALMAFAGAMAFRIGRRECDPPSMWLWLPLSFWQQYMARGLSVLYFPGLVFVPLAGVLWRTGMPLSHAAFALMGFGAGSFLLGLNLSVRLMGRSEIALWLYSGLIAAAVFGWGEAHVPAVLTLLFFGAGSFALLKGCPERLTERDTAPSAA